MVIRIKQAELLARFVHHGQKRQDGEDYIHHCERVAEAVRKDVCGYIGRVQWIPPGEGTIQEDTICAAWLHDCIEDYKNEYWETFKYNPIAITIACTFGRNVFDLVKLLTHYPKESYNDYILNLSKDPEAMQIKWADMIDNTSYPIPEKQFNKYRDACLHLQSEGIEIPSILKERLKI